MGPPCTKEKKKVCICFLKHEWGMKFILNEQYYLRLHGFMVTWVYFSLFTSLKGGMCVWIWTTKRGNEKVFYSCTRNAIGSIFFEFLFSLKFGFWCGGSTRQLLNVPLELMILWSKIKQVKYIQVHDSSFQSLEPNDLEAVHPKISSKFSYNSSCSFPHAVFDFPNHAHVEKAIPILSQVGQSSKIF